MAGQNTVITKSNCVLLAQEKTGRLHAFTSLVFPITVHDNAQ